MKNHHLKTALLCSSVFLLATPAFAQDAGANAAAAAAATTIEAVTVTGTHIAGGFTSPTPVTALSTAELTAASPANIPNALNQLPQFRNSSSNSTSPTWNSNALT